LGVEHHPCVPVVIHCGANPVVGIFQIIEYIVVHQMWLPPAKAEAPISFDGGDITTRKSIPVSGKRVRR
jgi:hypothetical protein